MADAIAQFAGAKYLNLETFRKSLLGVRTPVWFAQEAVWLARKAVCFARTVQFWSLVCAEGRLVCAARALDPRAQRKPFFAWPTLQRRGMHLVRVSQIFDG